MTGTSLPYRPCAGIMVLNTENKVWMGHRLAGDGDEIRADDKRWQMPQGGIDKDEDVVAAAYRELKEETGISSARLLTVTPGWLAYDFPPQYRLKNWRGQRQKWAAMLFEGKEDEIDLQADDHQEFDDWRWGELEEAPSLIVPFKRHVYEELMTAFIPLRDYIRAAH